MAMPLLANKLVNRNNQLRRKFALRAPTVILSRVCGGGGTIPSSHRHDIAAPRLFCHFRGPEGGRRGCKTAPQWERSLGNARGVLTEPRPPHGSREPHPGSTPWSLTRDSLTHALGGAFTFATQSDPTCPVPPWDQRIAVRQRCAHNRGIIRARVCIIDPLSPILQDLAIQPFGKQALRIGSCMAAGRTGEGGMISTLPRE